MKNRSIESVLEVDPFGDPDHGCANDESEALSDRSEGRVSAALDCREFSGETIVGVFVGTGQSGEILVNFAGNPLEHPVAAETTVPVHDGQIGQRVVLSVAASRKPIILGLIQRLPAVDSLGVSANDPHQCVTVEKDGERVVLSANREIVLRCGEASITLTRAGKVLIRGAYVLSRSSGVNRIKGGSVQIN